ncbi:MAG: HDOD domain-containing protein [Halieaceae bacterium]
MLKALLKGFSRKESEPTAAAASKAERVPSSLKLVIPKSLDPESLRRYQVFADLAHDELVLLAEKLTFRYLSADETLFEAGDEDELDYFLFEGNLRLNAPDGGTRELVSGSESASRVVSSLRPRKYTALAVTDCAYLELNRHVLNELAPPPASQSYGDDGDDEGDYEINELPAGRVSTAEAAALMQSFREDLAGNRFTLTSIPEVAIKIRKVMDDPDVPAKVISEIISTDPAIAAKISKAANSAFYRGYEPCDSLRDAVVRMGVKTTRQLVLSYTVRDLFQTGIPELRKSMRAAWDHTVYVGAIAAVLARRSKRFSPEEGVLAGLLSNIGTLSVFNYLANYPEIYLDEDRLSVTVDELKAEVGGLVLEHWSFPEELVLCARECESWGREREEGDKADLCDLVITASLHANIGHRPVPKIHSVGACERLLGDQLCPEFAKDFMQNAQTEIEEARALISG